MADFNDFYSFQGRQEFEYKVSENVFKIIKCIFHLLICYYSFFYTALYFEMSDIQLKTELGRKIDKK